MRDAIVKDAAWMIGVGASGEVQELCEERESQMFDGVIAWAEKRVSVDGAPAAEDSGLS